MLACVLCTGRGIDKDEHEACGSYNSVSRVTVLSHVPRDTPPGLSLAAAAFPAIFVVKDMRLVGAIGIRINIFGSVLLGS